MLVVIINFLNKAPEQVKSVTYPGSQMTCLQMLCQLLAKIFNLSQVIEDEMIMSSGVCLANAIFENVKEVGPIVIPGVLQIYLGQIQQTICSDVQKMLM